MVSRVLCRVLCAAVMFCVLTGGLSAQGKKGKPPGKIEPYSASVTALNGPVTTDVSVSIHTQNDISYPIPQFLKKLQLKILNDSGDVVYLRNFMDVPVTGNLVNVSVDDLQPLMPVQVQAHIQTSNTVDEEVLKAGGIVQLRPDLVVDTVRTPESVHVNTLFDVEVVAREILSHTGASANISLCEGETVLATATGIQVLAGNSVSILFQGLQLSYVGTHHLTAKIHDAVPGEYDTGNNEAAFDVEVVSPMVAVPYSLSYRSKKSHTYQYVYSGCWGYGESTTTHDNFDELQYSASFQPLHAIVSPIDSVSFQILSGNGTMLNIAATGINATSSTSNYDEYAFTVQNENQPSFYVTIRSYHAAGNATMEIYKFARDYYYRVQSNWGGTTTLIEQHDQMLNLQDLVEVRIALWDGTYAGGGGTSMTLQPFLPSSWSNYQSGGSMFCRWSKSWYEFYLYSTSYASGYTDPSILPGMNLARKDQNIAELFVPATTDLVQNYPNPFNPSTNIQFTVEHSGPAVLKVYDMLGKQVEELFSGEAIEGQPYRFTFRAGHLASGMYYAKLEAGGKQYIKKMLLMK